MWKFVAKQEILKKGNKKQTTIWIKPLHWDLFRTGGKVLPSALISQTGLDMFCRPWSKCSNLDVTGIFVLLLHFSNIQSWAVLFNSQAYKCPLDLYFSTVCLIFQFPMMTWWLWQWFQNSRKQKCTAHWCSAMCNHKPWVSELNQADTGAQNTKNI